MESKETAVVVAAPTVVIQKPAELMRSATEQANALTNLIETQKLYANIQGKKYVTVEGWVPLARMNGVIPREVSNEARDDGSYVARVQLIRIDDGLVLTEASAECGGPDEQLWQRRPPYARRSMAATRATGKACRLAYSWIIALAGYAPTPFEEMPQEERQQRRQKPPATERPVPQETDAFRGSGSPTWTSEKGGKTYIFARPGDTFSPEFLESIGMQLCKNKRDYYAQFTDEINDKLMNYIAAGE